MYNGQIEQGYNPPTPIGKADVKTVLEWGFKLLSVIVIPLIVWIVMNLVSMDKRLAIMEGNRFSATDGIKLREDISTIQRDLLRIQIDLGNVEECQIKIRTGKPDGC